MNISRPSDSWPHSPCPDREDGGRWHYCGNLN